MKTDLKGTR